MNIRQALLVFIAWQLCFTVACEAQTNGNELRRHIIYLASDSLHGRAPGTMDERHAADYISAYLRHQCGASVSEQRFPFRIDSLHSQDTAINVIGVIDRHRARTIIICAHYDHLGAHSSRSLDYLKKNLVHPGADDNASGVALLLELARWVKGQPALPYNFIFLTTSAHEVGLYGAKYFAGSHFADTSIASVVLNFDMVGRMNTGTRALKISASDTATNWQAVFINANDRNISFHFDNEVQNDFNVFAQSGYRAFSFTTGVHDDYHRHTDTADKINYDGMNDIFRLLKRVIKVWP